MYSRCELLSNYCIFDIIDNTKNVNPELAQL